MKRIAFIINPISGTGNKEHLIEYLHEVFTVGKGYSAIYYMTKGAGDAYEASKGFGEQGFDIVVAVGGDGTVNQVAKGLLYTDTKLAIIPFGSGNGLARHLKIPLSFYGAVDTILEGDTVEIDTSVVYTKEETEQLVTESVKGLASTDYVDESVKNEPILYQNRVHNSKSKYQSAKITNEPHVAPRGSFVKYFSSPSAIKRPFTENRRYILPRSDHSTRHVRRFEVSRPLRNLELPSGNPNGFYPSRILRRQSAPMDARR
mgnify:CR=1 FL=1